MCSTYLRSGELHSTSLRAKFLQKSFGTFLHWRCVLLLIYLLFVYLSMNWVVSVFYELGYKPGLFYFQNFQLWPLGALLIDSYVPLTYFFTFFAGVCVVCVCAHACARTRMRTHIHLHLHFLTFWHYKMLCAPHVYILPQSQNQPFLQGALVPFVGEAKVSVLCHWGVLLLKSSQLTARDTVFILISTNISNKKFA